jgi:hypothetical protein
VQYDPREDYGKRPEEPRTAVNKKWVYFHNQVVIKCETSATTMDTKRCRVLSAPPKHATVQHYSKK